jgi:voltage-gated sodium channel
MKRALRFPISERTVMAIVLFNATVLTLAGFYREGAPEKTVLEWIDYGCVVYFVIELVLKVCFFGWKGYIASGWNRFDFLVTILCLPVLWSPFINGSYRLGLAPIFRTGRLFRLFRLLRFIPNADHMVLGIRRALRASVGVFLALLLINVILALTATYIFHDESPEMFGNPARSFYSMFRIFTVEGWYEYPEALEESGAHPVWLVGTRLFFMACVLACGMLGFSLANAVFLDEMTMDNTRLVESKVDELSSRILSLEEKIERLREAVERSRS